MSVIFDTNLIINSVVIPLLVAVIIALITSIFAIRRFRREQFWSLKVKTYDTIFDALFDIDEFFRIQLKDVAQNDITEDEMDDVIDNYNEASYYLGRVLFKGEFIVQKDGIHELTDLNIALQIKEPGFWKSLLLGNKRYNFYKEQRRLIRLSTDKIRIIAKSDLKS